MVRIAETGIVGSLRARRADHGRSSRRRRVSVLQAAIAFVGLMAAGVVASAPRALPPPEVARLLEAPPAPKAALDPQGRYLLLVHQRDLLPTKSLTEPMLTVVGLKINPRNYGRHAPIAYYGLTLVDLTSGREQTLPVPEDTVLGFPSWSADGALFAFTVTRDDGIELWVGEPAEARVRRVLGPVLNATLSNPCTWMPDNHRLLCRVIDGPKRAPAPKPDPYASLTQPSMLRAVWQEEVVDQWAIQQYIESRLTLVDARTGARHVVGPRVAIEAVEPAPSGAYLLVSRLLRPYPQVAGVNESGKRFEVWDRFGNVVQSFDLDSSDATRARALQWHATKPATLIWIERTEDGDRVMSLAPPFSARPVELFRTSWRFAGLDWLESGGDALISDYDASQRSKRTWLVGEAEPRLIGEVSIDAAFPEFGRPLLKTNRWGKQVVAVHDGGIYLTGQDLDPTAGVRSYVDYLPLQSLESERRWQSSGKSSEAVIGIVTPDASVLLTRQESSRRPPNYYLSSAGGAVSEPVTFFSHPAVGIQDAHRIRLRYQRPDGYELSANLYLPAKHDSLEPLPVILWAYPRVYGTDTRSVTTIASERFPDFERAFKLFFLLQGYAVLDDVAMPVIGDGIDVNDTFVEQIVTNASAVIEAAKKTGYIDAERVGVAGHSYGAFMVANLLVHSDLFSAGIALSGAYNRTLTPFGFQTERRSLWEAPETYLAMSPFLYSNQIHEPLLLVHGLLDENAGTPPIQSIQFYEAIRHTGGQADILLLPREGHSYRGRESVLATAATMLDFFDAHLKRTDSKPAPEVLQAASVTQADTGEASTSLCSGC